ncbi:MAG: hypothetical protein Q8P18_19205 [Pseudomonadota bacterium]|nr:hypothetical protein [Pseudomonadota bacterium]
MPTDPYGFEDSAPVGTSSGDASRAMWFSVSSAMLTSVGMCACYVPYFVALPLGIYGAYLGSRALSTTTDVNGRSMATAGLVAGIISSLVSGMFALFIALYALVIVAYIAIVFVAIVFAAASGGGGY